MKLKDLLGNIDKDNIKDKIDETASLLMFLLDLKKFFDNIDSEFKTDTESESESESDDDFSLKIDDIELLSDDDD